MKLVKMITTASLAAAMAIPAIAEGAKDSNDPFVSTQNAEDEANGTGLDSTETAGIVAGALAFGAIISGGDDSTTTTTTTTTAGGS